MGVDVAGSHGTHLRRYHEKVVDEVVFGFENARLRVPPWVPGGCATRYAFGKVDAVLELTALQCMRCIAFTFTLGLIGYKKVYPLYHYQVQMRSAAGPLRAGTAAFEPLQRLPAVFHRPDIVESFKCTAG